MHFTTQDIWQTVQANYGFDPEAIHCSITGREIGVLDKAEYNAICANLYGETLEEVADDLAMRSLASMRPSLRWNRMRVETLEQMRVLEPCQTLAYLVNRLFTLPVSHKDYNVISMHLERIKMYTHLEQLSKETCEPLMLMLLELESSLGLLPEIPPFTAKQFRTATIEQMIALLQPWYAKRIEFYQQQLREAKFYAANPGARKAFARAWFEAKPASESQIKAQAKQKEANLLGAILDELMGNAEHKPAAQRVSPDIVESAKPSTTFVKPSVKMPIRFGAKATL